MIRVENLTKKFDSRGIAGLHHLSLDIQRGEIFGLMGPNGSGKTTLLKLLAGSLIADEGSIRLEGEVTLFPSPEELVDLNVQKYLVSAVTLKIDDDKKIQLARDLADTFEFTFQLRQKLSELSSGQKQRVLLAKELINSPSLLLLDEPFAHLDPFMRKEILESLFKYIKQKEMTVLWVTHDLEEALKFSDRLGLMNFGKLEQVDPPLSFIRAPRNLFVAQFMGYQNFYPIKFEDGGWITPWGKFSHPAHVKSEALLVITDRGWKTGEGLSFKVLERYPGNQCIHYVLSDGVREIVMKRSPGEEVFEAGATILVAPDEKETFVIPL